MSHIIVVGGGFAGIKAASSLAKDGEMERWRDGKMERWKEKK